MKLTLMLTLALLVTACAKTGPTERDQVCAGWEKIKGTRADIEVISDTLVKSIDAHHRYGERLGCW